MAMSTPSQKGKNPTPGPKVLLAGIRDDSTMMAREKINMTMPVIWSAFLIAGIHLSLEVMIRSIGPFPWERTPRLNDMPVPMEFILLFYEAHIFDEDFIAFILFFKPLAERGAIHPGIG